jgi:hypothetical protein
MTAIADHVRDAAHPIAEALRDLHAAGVRVPQVDVTVAYCTGGFVLRVADRSARHREAIEAEFTRVFVAAGWAVRHRPPELGGLGVSHPTTITRC